MKHVLFIIIVFLSTTSCDKDTCTYTLNERDYNLIPYEHNDTIIAIVDNALNISEQVLLVVSEGQLSVNDNVGALGKPLCDGTFEVFEIETQSNNENLISECIIEMRKDNDCLDFWIRLKINNYFMVFDMRPFGEESSSCNDISTEYFSQIELDGKEYKDVYLINGGSTVNDSLYYSSQTGFIKLIYEEGVVLFERK